MFPNIIFTKYDQKWGLSVKHIVYTLETNRVGTIRRMVDFSLVTVYKDSRSLRFSNNRIFILNLTFPTVPQYPHIFKKNFRHYCLINWQICHEIRHCLYLLPYLQKVGTFGRLWFLPDWSILYPGKCFLINDQQWSKILDLGLIIGWKNGRIINPESWRRVPTIETKH